MERALARHPRCARRVFTPEEIAYCDAQGAAGRVLRRPVRGPRGRDQGARRLPRASAGRTSAWPASRAAPRRSLLDRQREAPRRRARRRPGPHHLHARADERRRVRGGGDRPMKPVLTPAAGRRAGSRDAGARRPGRGADGAGRPRRWRRRRWTWWAARTGGARSSCAARGTTGGTASWRRGTSRGGGCGVAVVMIEVPEDLREPAATNLARLADTRRALASSPPTALPHELARADVAIDAIFGTGFRGMPEDEWATAIGELNAAGVPVVAVDIPSGVDGTSGAVAGDAVAAELTVTFGAAKTGALLLPGAERAGTAACRRHRVPRRSRADRPVPHRAAGRGRRPAAARGRHAQAGLGRADDRRRLARHDGRRRG